LFDLSHHYTILQHCSTSSTQCLGEKGKYNAFTYYKLASWLPELDSLNMFMAGSEQAAT
jgi:hypothetical protein